ncbi:MAG: DUF4340 domain-containing protein [Saprospiraceae bacterium]|nr:DUF4340 domain-containing protein [Saprospiraceae bacterium]
MKRNIILFLVLAGLIGAAIWMSKVYNKPTTLSDYEGSFAVPDTTMIGYIQVVDRDGNTLHLDRKAGTWYVNDRYRVEPRVMEEMLETVSQLEVKYIPPASMMPNIIKSLGAHGRRVMVSDLQGNPLKTYYIGGVAPEGTGTYCMMEGSDQPFVITMKYFHGSVSARFFMDEEDWRDHSLFPMNAEDIISFGIEYPRFREKSFMIERQGDQKLTVRPFYDLTPRIKRELDPDRPASLLDRLKDLRIEGFDNQNPERDSISQTLPFCVIYVTTRDSVERVTTLHSIVPHDRNGAILLDNLGRTLQVERYHVNSNWGDFMMVQHQPFSKIFWSYDMFFK